MHEKKNANLVLRIAARLLYKIQILFLQRTEDAKEVKSALPKEELKPSGDLDGNEGNVSKNLKFNPVKVVKEDLQKKLRLRNQLKDLKLKESTLENQLKEVSNVVNTKYYAGCIPSLMIPTIIISLLLY